MARNRVAGVPAGDPLAAAVVDEDRVLGPAAGARESVLPSVMVAAPARRIEYSPDRGRIPMIVANQLAMR